MFDNIFNFSAKQQQNPGLGATEQLHKNLVFMRSANDLHNTVLAQAAAAGYFPPEINRVYAAMVRDFYVFAAEWEGKTPEEVHAEHPLIVG